MFVGTASYDANKKALVTPGNASSAITSSLKHLEGQPTLSYAFWFNQTETNGNPAMIVNLSNDGVYSTGEIGGVFIASSGILYNTHGSRGIQLDSALSLGTWYHVVAVCDGPSGVDNMTLYINGVKPAQSNWGTVGASQSLVTPQLRIGGAADSSSTHMFDGQISNFKLYDCALTAQEVKTLYDMGRNGTVANPQPLHIAAPLYAPGTIVQVENTLKLDTFLSAGGQATVTLQDVPGMSVTIHPKFQNSKFLVSFVANVGTNGHTYLRVKRTQDGVSTEIAQPAAAGNRGVGVSYVYYYHPAGLDCYNFEYLDPTPLTSLSPITYQLQGYTFHPSYYFTINRGHVDTNNDYQGRASSTISVKEICQ